MENSFILCLVIRVALCFTLNQLQYMVSVYKPAVMVNSFCAWLTMNDKNQRIWSSKFYTFQAICDYLKKVKVSYEMFHSDITIIMFLNIDKVKQVFQRTISITCLLQNPFNPLLRNLPLQL